MPNFSLSSSSISATWFSFGLFVFTPSLGCQLAHWVPHQSNGGQDPYTKCLQIGRSGFRILFKHFNAFAKYNLGMREPTMIILQDVFHLSAYIVEEPIVVSYKTLTISRRWASQPYDSP